MMKKRNNLDHHTLLALRFSFDQNGLSTSAVMVELSRARQSCLLSLSAGIE